jgi:hypothetical protein
MKDSFQINFKNLFTNSITIPKMEDTIEFFKFFKEFSEEAWKTAELNPDVYGFQIQKNSKWNKGLSEDELEKFQQELNIKFPESLKNFYRVMNGLNLSGINIHGSSNEEPSYQSTFYSYPNDLDLIKDYIKWIFEANKINEEFLKKNEVSKIFPVHSHRFILTENVINQILSMYGNDIIYYADNISQLLMKDLFGEIYYRTKKINSYQNTEVKFWLE